MKYVILMLVPLALSGCELLTVGNSRLSQSSAHPEGGSRLSSREYAVMRCMLENEVKGRASAKTQVVLSELASADMLIDGLKDGDASDRVLLSAIRGFRAANHEKLAWPHDLDSRYDISLLKAEQSREIWRDHQGWKRFYQRFPAAYGVVTMSRLGFSDDGRVALVYRGCQSDWLAGLGRFYVLRLKWGRWVVTDERIGGMWVS